MGFRDDVRNELMMELGKLRKHWSATDGAPDSEHSPWVSRASEGDTVLKGVIMRMPAAGAVSPIGERDVQVFWGDPNRGASMGVLAFGRKGEDDQGVLWGARIDSVVEALAEKLREAVLSDFINKAKQAMYAGVADDDLRQGLDQAIVEAVLGR